MAFVQNSIEYPITNDNRTIMIRKTSSDGTSGNFSSGENISYWLDSVHPLETTTLNQDMETDVLVIGGGIAGLTTAYMLAKAGRMVMLVEDGLIGSGESGRTTAHLTCALDDHYQHIEKAFGEEEAVWLRKVIRQRSTALKRS